MDDSDSEYEVEESVVLVELNGIIDANFLLQEQSPTKMLGIDTDKPILQIGHYIFSGEYEHTTGTVVVYEPVDSPKSDAPKFEYLCKTDTKLTMKRIFIKEKANDKLETSEEVSCTIPIPSEEPAPSNISENLNSVANDSIEKKHPPEAHPETLNIENNVRRVNSNSEENEPQVKSDVQKSDPHSKSDSKKEKATKKLPSKKKAFKSVISDNTLRPEESLNLKNKGQKRKRGAIGKGKQQHDVDTNLAESANEDIELRPCSRNKQLKVQVDDHDEQQKRESNEPGKEEIHMQEKNEPNVQAEDKSNVQEKDVTKMLEKDEPIAQEKSESIVQEKGESYVQEKDETEMQEEDEVIVQEKSKSVVQEKDESNVPIKDKIEMQKKDEPIAQEKGESIVQEKGESNVQKKDETEMQEEDEVIVQEKSKSVVQEKDESNVPIKDKIEMQKKDEPIAQEKGESIVQEKGVSNVQEKNETEMQEEDELIVQEKSKFVVQEKDESNVPIKDKIEMQKEDEPIAQEKGESIVQEKGESNLQEKDVTKMPEKDEPIAQEKSESIVLEKGESNVQKKDETEMQEEDEVIVQEKSKSVVQEKDESNVPIKDKIEMQKKDEPIAQEKGESIVQEKGVSNVQEKNETEMQEEDELIVQEKSKFVVQEKDESNVPIKDKIEMQKEDEPIAQEKGESIVQEKGESNVQEKNETEMQEEDELIVQEKSKFVVQEKDESNVPIKDKIEMQKEDEPIAQEKGESIVQEKGESNLQEKDVTKMPEKDEPIAQEKSESIVLEKGESCVQEKDETEMQVEDELIVQEKSKSVVQEKDESNVPIKDKIEKQKKDEPIAQEKGESIVQEKGESNVQEKNETEMQEEDELIVQEKSKFVVQEKDESNVPIKDKIEMQKEDEPIAQEKGESIVQEKGESNVQEKDVTKMPEKDEPIAQEKSESIVLEKGESCVQEKDETEMQEEDELIVQEKSKFVVQEKDESNVPIKDKIEMQKDEPIAQEKGESIVQEKGESNVQEKNETEMQEEDELIVQEKSKFVVQEKDESNVPIKDKIEMQKDEPFAQEKGESIVQEEESIVLGKGKIEIQDSDELIVQEKSESIVQEKGESNVQEKDKTEMQEEDELIVQEKSKSVVQESNVPIKDKIEMQKEDKPVVQENGESIVQREDESNVQDKKETEMQVGGDVQKRDESIVHEQDESNVQGANKLVEPCTSDSSVNDIVNQDTLLSCPEGSSVSNKKETDTNNLHLSGEISNEASPQKEAIVIPLIDIIENVPVNEVVDVETPTIHSSANNETISNSETVNQLVESSTDKMLLSDTCTSIDEIRGDGNCSSSGDTVFPRSRDVISSDICQSSDSQNIPTISHEPIDKLEDNGASSSTCHQSRNSSLGKESNMEEQIVSENSPHSKSVQTDTIKPASCEVSQSLDDENQASIANSEVKDSNECETSASPLSLEGQVARDLDIERDIYNAGEGSSNAIDVSISSESQSVVEGTEQTKRKLSSCEVTQSNSSEREFSETPDEVSECEVFSQNPLPGIENMFNRSSNEAMSPFGLVAGSSDEVGYSRHSLASESSTSEVSQSHRSVIQESRSVEERHLDGLPFTDGAVCSQSSDQVNEHLSETTTENKDLCVSSCDVSKDESAHDESIESDKNTRNAGCEVSQSDKTDANTSSENSDDERLVSNECDAPTHVLEGNLISPSINPSGIGMLNIATEDTDTATSSRRPMACEVTQSFSSTNNASGSEVDLNTDDKLDSSECDNYENSGPSSEGLNDDLNNNCVSSDDVVHFLSPREDAVEEQEKDPMCEVSQSFRPGENIVSLEEPCGSSDLASDRVQRNLNANEPESRNSCEVTQSLELESSSVSELYEDEDDSINECERSNLNLDAVDQSDVDVVDQSDDYVEDICESSDDVIVISNDESNSQSEQLRPVNYSGCEVSQSYRLEDGILIPQPEQFFDVGVESSNECEVYASSVSSAPEYNINRSDSDEKNICESSDDIERISGDIKYSSQHSKSDSQEACQSTKCDGNFSYDAAKVECTGNNSNEYNAGNEASDLTDDEINVCESSEDINVTENSPEPNSGACSSSDKLFKKPIDSNRDCDSLSSQAIPDPSTAASPIEMEGNQISQSESETYLVSSDASQSDSVKVSSSVDSISSNFVDVIYSSSNVSNSTVSSNSEVSQSSVRKGPYVWSGNLLSAASSSNSSVGIVADVSSEQQFAASFSGEANVQSTANDSILATEASDPALLTDSHLSSSRNNDAIESSISSSSASGNRIKKHILKLKKSYDVSPENLSMSQSTSATKEQNRESVILGGNSSNKSDLSDNSGSQNQPEVDSMSQQFAFHHGTISQVARSTDSDPRPSLLEVMVSSASDFRNSLLLDSTSFGKETNISSVVESSSNNVRSANEFSESHNSDVTGHLIRTSEDAPLEAIVPQSVVSVENSESTRTEVSGSTEGEEKYQSSSGSSGSRQQVSQSSDIVNTHSSTSQTQVLASDGISESFRPDFVQSSSQVRKTFHTSTKTASMLTIGSEIKNFNVSDNSKIAEAPESSSTQVSMPTFSRNTANSSENSAQLIESSNELPLSFARSRNVDSEVSSTPSNMNDSNPEVLSMDGSDQCSFIEGNLVLFPGSDTILNRPEVSITQVEGTSAHGDFVPFKDGRQLLIQTSNEADTLNSNLVFSSSAIQMPLREEIGCSSGNVSAKNLEREVNVSTTPANDVIAIAEDGDHSSEVSESLASDQNDLSQSVLADNNVSCSVVEFSLNNETFDKKYSFNEGEFSGTSREAESKSDDGISSYQSVCDDNILTVPNLSSSANAELSMYSHIGEFEDSIQSSSLDATHFSINEQIKAISSPPTFSNSESSEEQVPTSINAFVSFSSESHNLPSLQYSLPSISNIPQSFMAEGISSRLQTETILEDRSILTGGRVADISSRSTVVQSPNSTYTQEHSLILGNPVSESGSRGTDNNVDESSQISSLGGAENSPEEYEVLSEYEDIENAVDDSNLVDSSND